MNIEDTPELLVSIGKIDIVRVERDRVFILTNIRQRIGKQLRGNIRFF